MRKVHHAVSSARRGRRKPADTSTNLCAHVADLRIELAAAIARLSDTVERTNRVVLFSRLLIARE